MFAELGEMLRQPDQNGNDKLNDVYQKIIGLPSRVDSVKKLAEALKTLVGLEREAYGMNTDHGTGEVKRLSDLIDELSN